MRRTLLTAAAVLTLTAALGACTSAHVNTTPAGTNQVQTSAAHTGTAAAPVTSLSAARKAGVGDTVNVNGSKPGDVLAVTLTKIVDPAPPKDDILTPDPGKRFVAIQIKIVNNGKNVYSDDPQADVKAKDGAGEEMELAFGSSNAGAELPSSVDLTPGDQALGYVTFQVPTGVKITQVQYALMSFGGDNVAQWTIN